MQQVRAEGDAVQPFDLAREDAAFQTRMQRHDLGLFAVLRLVHSYAAVAQGAFAGVGPSRVVAMEPHAAAQQLGERLHLAAQQLLRRGHRAAQGEAQDGFAVVQLGNAEVQRGLHKARHIHAHALHTPGHQQQGFAQTLGGVRIQCIVFSAALLGELQADARVSSAEFCFHLRGKVCPGSAHGFGDTGGQHQRNAAFFRDDVFLCTAGEGEHSVLCTVVRQQGQVAPQQSDGVGAAFVNLGAGVPSRKSRDVRLHGGAGHSRTGDGQMALDAASARTACGEHAFFL